MCEQLDVHHFPNAVVQNFAGVKLLSGLLMFSVLVVIGFPILEPSSAAYTFSKLQSLVHVDYGEAV